VQRPIFEKFVNALKEKAEALTIGPSNMPGVCMGPLISAEHKAKVLSYYQKAKAEGAHVVTGGGEPSMSGAQANGHFVQPTIWTGLPESSAIIREEIFGPCCHIAPFDTEEEAIHLANDTPYGLATSIWTTDISVATRMANAVHVGLCWINSWFLRDLRTPFGGSKGSGIGREGGVHSLEFYTDLRNVMIKI
ncbi:MAG: aldehyde dehydrogenase family protein, partial [Burkholderiaceae bacterium]